MQVINKKKTAGTKIGISSGLNSASSPEVESDDESQRQQARRAERGQRGEDGGEESWWRKWLRLCVALRLPFGFKKTQRCQRGPGACRQ